jgi:hypothetical protein
MISRKRLMADQRRRVTNLTDTLVAEDRADAHRLAGEYFALEREHRNAFVLVLMAAVLAFAVIF